MRIGQRKQNTRREGADEKTQKTLIDTETHTDTHREIP